MKTPPTHAPVPLSLKLAFLALLAIGSLGFTGCSTMGAAMKMPASVARMSPAPAVTTPYQAIESAKSYVAAHPGSDYEIGSGNSMFPLYQDRDVIVIERPAISDLKVGQTVVFTTSSGILTAHVLVAHTSDGWITMGMNNASQDDGFVTDSSYIGVVVKAYRPTGSAILAYWKTSPQNPRNLVASNP